MVDEFFDQFRPDRCDHKKYPPTKSLKTQDILDELRYRSFLTAVNKGPILCFCAHKTTISILIEIFLGRTKLMHPSLKILTEHDLKKSFFFRIFLREINHK